MNNPRVVVVDDKLMMNIQESLLQEKEARIKVNFRKFDVLLSPILFRSCE